MTTPNLLIVDDEKTTREGLRAALEDKFEVYVAEDAKSAWQLLEKESFAVLLTDLFPTRVRFTGVALVFNVSFTIFSGTAPLIATALIRDTGQNASPAYMMMVSDALALVGTLWIERFGGNVLARRGSQ